MRNPKRTIAAIATAAVLTITGFTAPPAAAGVVPDPPTLPAADSHGITVVDWAKSSPNETAPYYDVTLTTDAIHKNLGPGAPTVPAHPRIKVRILLPVGYRTDPAHPYKSLYLLHGGNDTFASWSDKGNVAAISAAAGFDNIVVMPEAGDAGWYSDWVTGTTGNIAPQWETFHIGQLVPWIDANFNTVANRSGRYIAGLSMGGYGALRYAGRHPDLFSAAGGFSPGTNIEMPWAQALVHGSVVQVPFAPTAPGAFIGAYDANTSDLAKYRYPLGWLWGPHQVFGTIDTWDTQNPVKIATAGGYGSYNGRFAVYAGNTSGGSDAQIHGDAVDFHTKLNTAGTTHRFCSGPGTHDWPYWQNDLADFLKVVAGTASDTQCTTNPGWTKVS
ncbi:alpha/beta hydrolase family protein [Embleya sp. NBC_00896]|uniref:alpha/beta hydrolase n=1 Tax=Embleya sp. NBC_00896 TaxID=2975961 RepID=UPI002F90F712|nr:esterase family protein [Embleya sp. NBC_00896]